MDSVARVHRTSECLLVLCALFWRANVAQAVEADLLDLSIEELANLRITTASRIEESLSGAPASVFVITGDEIRRAGVTSIPEALRLAPGVEVARRGAHEWSISIRGFNSDLANKLLVLIDGRSVYSPLFAGVFWDAQDTLLEDIDRIEVISGPGGSLWGANAVNGIINIITRSADSTMGPYVELLAGSEDRIIAGLRHGGRVGDKVAARAFVKYIDRDSTEAASGDDSVEDVRMARVGFRLDWEAADVNRFMLQGDAYQGRTDGIFNDTFTIGTLPAGTFRDEVRISGAFLVASWERQTGPDSDFRLQAYYDHTRRDIPNTYDERRDTIDLDFQHHLSPGENHDLLWGLNYRQSSDNIGNTTFATFTPADRTTHRFGGFLQDRIALIPERLFLTIGSKFGYNDYTGFEYQPNARLAWHADQRQTLWSAVSRGVRIPSRLDDDLVLTIPLSAPGIPFPFYVVVNGSNRFESEKLLAYEAGYRLQHSKHLAFEVALFQNEYHDLQTNEPDAPIVVLAPPLPHIIVPNHFENNMRGESSGGTFVVNLQPLPTWRLRLQYSYLHLSLETIPQSQDVSSPAIAGNSPRHQVALHSFMDLPHEWELYAGLRYVDHLPNQGVDSYMATDVNVTWRFSPRASISLAVQNLLDDTHPEFEFGSGNLIERSASLRLQWKH